MQDWGKREAFTYQGDKEGWMDYNDDCSKLQITEIQKTLRLIAARKRSDQTHSLRSHLES